jgi:hypothetical protein
LFQNHEGRKNLNKIYICEYESMCYIHKKKTIEL